MTATEGWLLASVITAALAALVELTRLRDPAPLGALVVARALGHLALGMLALGLLVLP